MTDMTLIRRCLGCAATYPADGHVCPECGSHAGEVEEDTPKVVKPRPARRKT